MLRRHVDCARALGADHVVRVTGDNPLTDLETARALVALHLARGRGLHLRARRRAAHGHPLRGRLRAPRSSGRWERGEARHRSELMTLYIKEHPEEFAIVTADAAPGPVPAGVPPHRGRAGGRAPDAGDLLRAWPRPATRDRRARPSRSWTASPPWPASTATCATRRPTCARWPSTRASARSFRPKIREALKSALRHRWPHGRQGRALLRDRGGGGQPQLRRAARLQAHRDGGRRRRRRHQVPELHRGQDRHPRGPALLGGARRPAGHAVGHVRQARQALRPRLQVAARRTRGTSGSPHSPRRSTTRRSTSSPPSTCPRSRSPPPTSPATASSSARPIRPPPPQHRRRGHPRSPNARAQRRRNRRLTAGALAVESPCSSSAPGPSWSTATTLVHRASRVAGQGGLQARVITGDGPGRRRPGRESSPRRRSCSTAMRRATPPGAGARGFGRALGRRLRPRTQRDHDVACRPHRRRNRARASCSSWRPAFCRWPTARGGDSTSASPGTTRRDRQGAGADSILKRIPASNVPQSMPLPQNAEPVVVGARRGSVFSSAIRAATNAIHRQAHDTERERPEP